VGIKLLVGKAIDNVLDRLVRYNYRWATFVPTGRILPLDLKRWRLEPEVIFDVGANEGQTALYFSRHFRRGKIYCFEPVSAVFDLLLDNCNRPNIMCFRQALGDEDTIKRIFKSASYNGVASINGAKQGHLSHEENVQVTKGESIHKALGLSTIDLLKIDTEGYELNVLKGFGSLLTEKVKMVFAETGFLKNNPCQTPISDLIDYMSANGFIVSGMYNQFRFSHKKMVLHHCDILFTNTQLVDV
jgi:FkbM family methyltransferase